MMPSAAAPNQKEKISVLILDNDPDDLEIFTSQLANPQIRTIPAGNRVEFLQILSSQPIDLCIVELFLADLDGFEICETLSRLEKGKNIPIILVSRIFKKFIYEREARERFHILDYYDKPFNMEQFKAKILNHFFSPPEAKPTPPAVKPAPRPPAIQPPDKAKAKDPRAVAMDKSDATAGPVQKELEPAAVIKSPSLLLQKQTDKGGGAIDLVCVFKNDEIHAGSLSEIPFTIVLNFIYKKQLTGALFLTKDRVKKIVYFNEGYPLFIKSNLLNECLGQLLIKDKIISVAENSQALQLSKATKRPIGAILVEMGFISPHNLNYALLQQQKMKLFDIFNWDKGSYRFHLSKIPPASMALLNSSPANLILEGVKKSYSLERLEKLLSPYYQYYLSWSLLPKFRFQIIELQDIEKKLLSRISDNSPVHQIVHLEKYLEKQILQLLFSLISSEILLLSERPKQVSADTPKFLQYFIYKDRGPDESLNKDTARQLLLKKLEQIKNKPIPEILGVSLKASRDEIQQAFYQTIQEFHPDRFIQDIELVALSEEVITIISKAYTLLLSENLNPPDKAYLEKKYLDRIESIIAAEECNRNGESAEKIGEFEKAKKLYEQAVSICPDPAKYYVALGRITFKLSNLKVELLQKAKEYCKIGIAHNPKQAEGYLYLGYIAKAVGDSNGAMLQFHKALQADPDLKEAKMALENLKFQSHIGGL